MFKPLATVLGVVVALTAAAEPRDEVRAAIEALRDASGYSWVTTARQTTREYPDYKRPADLADPVTTIEVQGRSDANGFLQVTLPPSKTTAEVPVTALIRSSVEAVADTPIGWLTRQEMRDSPRRNETAQVDGKAVKLYKFFAAATRATNVESPVVELLMLLADIQTYEVLDGGIAGRLKPAAAMMLQDRAGASGGAGEMSGTVLFQIRNGVLAGVAIKLVTEIPRRDREPIKAITRWAMSFSAVGATSVTPPREVVNKLAKLSEN